MRWPLIRVVPRLNPTTDDGIWCKALLILLRTDLPRVRCSTSSWCPASATGTRCSGVAANDPVEQGLKATFVSRGVIYARAQLI